LECGYLRLNDDVSQLLDDLALIKERAALEEKKFKYKREDFGELPVKLDHLDIYLNFLDGFVEASNTLQMTAKCAMQEIEFDAKELTLVRVEWIENVNGEDHSNSL
jgi:hypothetical protein